MGTLRVLSQAGDTATTWDPARVAAGDAEAVAAVREAERIFAEQRQQGGTAVRMRAGQPAARMETFDPLAEHILLVPRVIGG